MRRIFWPVMVLMTSQLGRCPTCMRISFRAALLSWVVAAGVVLASLPQAAVLLAGLGCAGFTGLWLAHVTAFSVRSAKAKFAKMQEREGAGRSDGPASWPRRNFFASFARIFALAAMATMVPLAARADCNCYTENNCYCPNDAPNCFFNPSTGVGFCCASSVGCGNAQGEWCCPNQCGGDTGTCLR